MTPCKKKLRLFGIAEKWRKYMRLTIDEKEKIIRLTEGSELGVNKTWQNCAFLKARFTIGTKLT